jgi:Mce-associated membrane protein
MRLRRWVFAVAGPLAIAVIVGLSAAGGWFFWQRVQTEGEQSARVELPKLAAQRIPEIFAYDYQTVERSLSAAYPLMTPEYRQEFEKRAVSQIIPEAKKREVVLQANVVGVGVMEAKRTSGSVLVYLNQSSTDKASRDPVYNGSRIRVDYKKIRDKWLIAYIAPI